jgi:hypothetical protein
MRDFRPVALLLTFACSSAYYSVWEKLGKEKRDLLISHISRARDQQKETSETFKDALTRLQEAYGKSGSELEKAYERLKDRTERSDKSAKELRSRIARADKTAGDLFAEWESEIGSLSSEDFKRRSREKLERTRSKYSVLSRSMHDAEKRIEPVLSQLHDYTTFLKHNLNAQSLGELQKEKISIERDTARLIKEMQEAIDEAGSFLQTMEQDAA